jgi:hypothetical protein
VAISVTIVFIAIILLRVLYLQSSDDSTPIEFKDNSWTKYPSNKFKSNPYKQFCGVEIETINDIAHQGLSSKEQSEYAFNMGGDGSLSGYATAEFRSYPKQGDDLLNSNTKFCNLIQKRGWHVNSSCVLHIHIETPRDLDIVKKLYMFYNKYENLFFKMLPPSRRNNCYCEKIDNRYSLNKFLRTKDLNEFMKLFYETNWYKSEVTSHACRKHKRYCWLNLHSVFYRGTLEIRAHAGTVNPRKINNWLLIHLAIRNKLEKMTPEQVYNLGENKETLLTFFNKPLRDYIKER